MQLMINKSRKKSIYNFKKCTKPRSHEKKKKKKRMKKNYSSGVRIVPQGKTMNY